MQVTEFAELLFYSFPQLTYILAILAQFVDLNSPNQIGFAEIISWDF